MGREKQFLRSVEHNETKGSERFKSFRSHDAWRWKTSALKEAISLTKHFLVERPPRSISDAQPNQLFQNRNASRLVLEVH